MIFMNYHLLETEQHIGSVGGHLERPQRQVTYKSSFSGCFHLQTVQLNSRIVNQHFTSQPRSDNRNTKLHF